MPQLTASSVAQDDIAQDDLAPDAATPDKAGAAQPMFIADEGADSIEDAGRVHIGGGMMHF